MAPSWAGDDTSSAAAGKEQSACLAIFGRNANCGCENSRIRGGCRHRLSQKSQSHADHSVAKARLALIQARRSFPTVRPRAIQQQSSVSRLLLSPSARRADLQVRQSQEAPHVRSQNRRRCSVSFHAPQLHQRRCAGGDGRPRARRACRVRRHQASGLLEGETLGEAQRTGANLAAGLAVGLLTGLIGTGIGYFVIGPSSMNAEAVQRSNGKNADFQLGLKTGFEKKTQSKKRGAFLAGGLLGTAAWIAMLASARGGE